MIHETDSGVCCFNEDTNSPEKEIDVHINKHLAPDKSNMDIEKILFILRKV